MNEYITFITNHWILASIFAFLLVLYVLIEMFYKTNIKTVSPQQAVALINHAGGVILDIRTQEAFVRGHIVGAINIASAALQGETKKLQKYVDKPIIVTCSTGRDAAKVVAKLEASGFKHAVQMAGGIENWMASGLPLTK